SSHEPLVRRSKPFKSSAIEVVRRRKSEQNSRAHRVYPGKIAEDILLAVAIAYPGCLLIGIVRYLEIVSTGRAYKTELIIRRGSEDQRGKRSSSCRLVMQVRRGWSFQAVIAAVSIQAHV